MSSTTYLMTYSDEASYLEVLTARQSLLQALVNLYHALGGGEE